MSHNALSPMTDAAPQSIHTTDLAMSPSAHQSFGEPHLHYAIDPVGNTHARHVTFTEPEHYPITPTNSVFTATDVNVLQPNEIKYFTAPTPYQPNIPPRTTSSAQARSEIGPDGKTIECNRHKTFETFISNDKLVELEPQKREGHAWEICRAVAKFVRKVGGWREEKRTGERSSKKESIC